GLTHRRAEAGVFSVDVVEDDLPTLFLNRRLRTRGGLLVGRHIGARDGIYLSRGARVSNARGLGDHLVWRGATDEAIVAEIVMAGREQRIARLCVRWIAAVMLGVRPVRHVHGAAYDAWVVAGRLGHVDERCRVLFGLASKGDLIG